LKKVALIVAGGNGSRFGADVPKHFLCIDSIPIFIHSIKIFIEADALTELILLVNVNFINLARDLLNKHLPNQKIEITAAGNTRTDTVSLGLKLVHDDTVVAIHDAARPFVSVELINTMFDAMHNHVAAIPIVPVTDTLLHLDKTVQRADYFMVQTPQCFHANVIKKCYDNRRINEVFTDDATLVSRAGHAVAKINGETGNIKITFNDAIANRLVHAS
jgi:2-C-methyl-D-erythritol 4-phosphate cytidylyltransferase